MQPLPRPTSRALVYPESHHSRNIPSRQSSLISASAGPRTNIVRADWDISTYPCGENDITSQLASWSQKRTPLSIVILSEEGIELSPDSQTDPIHRSSANQRPIQFTCLMVILLYQPWTYRPSLDLLRDLWMKYDTTYTALLSRIISQLSNPFFQPQRVAYHIQHEHARARE